MISFNEWNVCRSRNVEFFKVCRLTEIYDGGFGLGTSITVGQENIAADCFAEAKESAECVGGVPFPGLVVSVDIYAK